MLFNVTQNISDGNRFSSLKAKDILRITTTPVFQPTSVALYQTLSRPRKRVSRENLKIFRPHPAPTGDRPRGTIDFIGSNCNMPRISPPATSPSPAQKKPSAAHGLTHPSASFRAISHPFALLIKKEEADEIFTRRRLLLPLQSPPAAPRRRRWWRGRWRHPPELSDNRFRDGTSAEASYCFGISITPLLSVAGFQQSPVL